MEITFEQQYSALQTDMVSICLEYCEHKASNVFIHVIYERDSIFTNFFFKINGKMFKKGKLDDSIGTVSLPRQKEALSIITKNTQALIKLCEESNKPAPTEMKLVYDVKKNSLQANYSYDAVTTAQKTAKTFAEEWFAENEIEI